jgi:hypothetical protein
VRPPAAASSPTRVLPRPGSGTTPVPSTAPAARVVPRTASSGRMTPVGRMGSAPSGGSGRHRAVGGAVSEDRKTLGLSEMRPSEMVTGLEAVAKRAEKQEAIERIKQRSGRIIMNEAIHTDEKGRRWARLVIIGIVVLVLLVVGTVGTLYYLATHKRLDPRHAAGETRNYLTGLEEAAQQIKPFPPDTKVSAEEFKGRLKQYFEGLLAQEEQAAEEQKKKRGQTDVGTNRNIGRLRRILAFQDGFGRDFVFEAKDPEAVVIRSPSVTGPDSERRVTVRRERTTPEKPAPEKASPEAPPAPKNP